jgi:hypothetical protein
MGAKLRSDHISVGVMILSLRSFSLNFYQTIIRFKAGIWEQTTRDKDGKVWVVTSYVNDQGQQQLVSYRSFFIVLYICFFIEYEMWFGGSS